MTDLPAWPPDPRDVLRDPMDMALEAWKARCRVAVEALERLIKWDQFNPVSPKDWLTSDHAYWAGYIHGTLARIGSLPPEKP